MCGVPQLHLHYPDETTSASVEVWFEFERKGQSLLSGYHTGWVEWNACYGMQLQ